MSKKKKIFSILLTITVILIPIALFLNNFKKLDNDLWYILTEGRYITQNGLYYTDVLSMHEGFDIVIQNWLSAVLFWNIYNYLGFYGIFFMIIIVNCIILFLLYKISMLISDNNKYLSIFTALSTDIILCYFYITSRPQILSYTIILLVIYLLELYIKKNNSKYLKYIPLLALLEINLHASIWLYIFLFMIPYIIDSFKCPKLMLQGYRKKPLIITFIISILISFINPYGYKAITFIFNSFGNKEMHNNITELLPFTFSNSLCITVFGVITITAVIYILCRKGLIRVRYICLYFGTLIIGMISVKALSYFIIVAIFPIALLLKDSFPRDFKKHALLKKKIGYILVIILTITLLSYSVFKYNKMKGRIKLSMVASFPVEEMNKYRQNSNLTTFVSFNMGGYLEYHGYKSYIDPRAEVFIKKNNHKKDIFKEYTDLNNDKIDPQEFFKEYNFDYIFLSIDDKLFSLNDIDNYSIIYNEECFGYKVFARNDIIEKNKIKSN